MLGCLWKEGRDDVGKEMSGWGECFLCLGGFVFWVYALVKTHPTVHLRSGCFTMCWWCLHETKYKFKKQHIDGGGKGKTMRDLMTWLILPPFPWSEGLCLAGKAKCKSLLIDVINYISTGSLVNAKGEAKEVIFHSPNQGMSGRGVPGHLEGQSLQWGRGTWKVWFRTFL